MFFFLFRLPFLLIVGAVAFAVANQTGKRKKELRQDAASPVRTVWARVVSRRTAETFSPEYGYTYCYYMTFEAPDGSTLELGVQSKDYNTLQTGECGKLIYQENRFLNFVQQPFPAEIQASFPPQDSQEYPPQDNFNQTGLF